MTGGGYQTNKKQLKWDVYFLNIAHEVSSRATCDRLHAGAVIVRDRRIMCTGYNGSMIGAEHCDAVGHQMVRGHCLRTVHAEVNAVAQAAKFGVSIDGATAYVIYKPCYDCIKVLVNSGIKRIVYEEIYDNIKFDYLDLLRSLDIRVLHLPLEHQQSIE